MALGRWTSRVLQILGFAGLLVCLALAVGILLGRSWIAVAVGDVFTAADDSISVGLARIDDATARLTDGGGLLDGLVADLGPVPATSPIPAAVAARISQVVDSYGSARDRYVEARSQAQAAFRLFKSAGRLAPGAQVPAGVATALAAADDRISRLDSALTEMRGAARSTAGDVAAAATTLRDTVTNAAATARSLRGEIDGLRVRIADVHAGVDRILWLGTGALLAVVGYVALLNLLVVWLARRASRAVKSRESVPPPLEANSGL
jgi:hypothetical protein